MRRFRKKQAAPAPDASGSAPAVLHSARRAEGRLTEAEEAAVLHQFRSQSTQAPYIGGSRSAPLAPSDPSHWPRPLPRALTPTPTSTPPVRAGPPPPTISVSTLDDFHRQRTLSTHSGSSRFGRVRGTLEPRSASTSRSVSPSIRPEDQAEADEAFERLQAAERRAEALDDGSDDGHSASGLLGADLSPAQIRRISAVLDDMENELSRSHPHLIAIHDENEDETSDTEAAYDEEHRGDHQDTEEVDPHMGGRSALAVKPSLSSIRSVSPAPSATQLYVPPLRSTSARVNGAEPSRHPLPAPLRQFPMDRARQYSDDASAASVSPALATFVHRFPSVPERDGSAAALPDESVDSVPSDVTPDSSAAGASLQRSASTGSAHSSGSSYRGGELNSDGEPTTPVDHDLDDGRGADELLDPSALAGMALADVAFIQETLFRSASLRLAARAASVAKTPSSLPSEPVEALAGVESSEMDRSTTASTLTSPSMVTDSGVPMTPDLTTASSASSWVPRHGHQGSDGSNMSRQSSSLGSHSSVPKPRRPMAPPPTHLVRSQSEHPTSPPAVPPQSVRQHRLERTAAGATTSMMVAQRAEAATAALKSTDEPMSPVRTTHSRSLSRKSSTARSRTISSPRLITTSASLTDLVDVDRSPSPPPPPVPPAAGPRHLRKHSSTNALRSLLTRRSTKVVPNGAEIVPFELNAAPLPPRAPVEMSTPPQQSAEFAQTDSARSSVTSPGQTSGSSGLKHVMSRLRRRKTNETGSTPVSPGSTSSSVMPSPRLDNLPSPPPTAWIETPSPSMASRAPTAYDVGGSWRTRRGTMSPHGEQSAVMSPMARSPPPQSPFARSDHSRTSMDSLRQLMEAAADLGLDTNKVAELVEAASPRQSTAIGTSQARAAESDPSVQVETIKTPPRTPQRSATISARTSSRHAVGATVGGHRRASSDASATRSLRDRPPTPPPTSGHKRKISQDIVAPAGPVPALPVPAAATPMLSRASSLQTGSGASGRSHGSYAASVFDVYGEDGTALTMDGIAKGPPSPVSVVAPIAETSVQPESAAMQDVWQVLRTMRRVSSESSAFVPSHSRDSSIASLSTSPPSSGMRPFLLRQKARPPVNGGSMSSSTSDPNMQLLIRHQRQTSASSSIRILPADAATTDDTLADLTSSLNHGTIDLVRQRSLQRVHRLRQEASS